MKEQRVRENPRISLNCLAEYLVAGAARRRKIVHDQKHPTGYQLPYYTEAEDAIADCLALPAETDQILDRAMTRLRHIDGSPKEWELTRREVGIEALRAFRSFSKEIPLEGLTVARAPRSQRLLQISGIGVSVRPEIYLASAEANTQQSGALKLFVKKAPLTEERALYTGTILHQYLDTQRQRTGTVDYRNCLVLDVFAKKVFSAPRTYKRRRTDVEAACLEITLAWETA